MCSGSPGADAVGGIFRQFVGLFESVAGFVLGLVGGWAETNTEKQRQRQRERKGGKV